MTRFTRTERHVLALTGVAHTATHYAELVYPTLAVALARETGIPLERVLGTVVLGAIGGKFVLTFGVGSAGVWLVRTVQATSSLADVFRVLAGVVGLLLVAILALVALTRPREAAAGAVGEVPIA